MTKNQMIKKESCFNFIMNIYDIALSQIFQELTCLKDNHSDIISNVTKRIKNPDSIMKKMKKKHFQNNYTNLIERIDDIAGIRIVCPFKENIYTVLKLIKEIDSIYILKGKDYIRKPKKSGYSAYHLIVETPININDTELLVKVEIQIRTMAMDFWATNEHDIRYKTNKKISIFDSKKLSFYARILNILDDKMMKLRKKQNFKSLQFFKT